MPSQVFKVKSIYEYESQHLDDLHFPIGQIIDVTNDEDDEWYTGEYLDDAGAKQEGIFPRNFVEKYEPAAPPRPIRPTKGIESTSESLDSTSAELEIQSTAENILVDSAHSTPPLQESPPRKPSVKVNTPGSTFITRASKFHRSSPPSRVPSFEKKTPPPIFEKPASNSFKDRVAAFNKASSSVPGPLKPGGLVSGDLSSFIKKPFIAPPPSKDAYIPLPKDHSLPSKLARREVDPALAKKEGERQVKSEKFSSEPTDLKDLVNVDVKPTTLKERIALLQKQQMEQASRLADAAHKKDKIKRPIKKHIEPSSQIEAVEQNNLNLSETIDSKVSKSKLLDEEKKIISNSSKSSDESPFPRVSSSDENDADTPGGSEDTTESEDKYKSHVSSNNGENSQITTSNSRIIDNKNEESTDQDEDEDENEDGEDEDEKDEEIDAEIKRKEELRARMAKMSGGMNMHGIFGPPGGIPMPSVITPKKKNNNPSHVNDIKENPSISSPQRESFAPIPLPGMAQIKPHDVRNNENKISDLATLSPQASPRIEGIDSNNMQISSPQESSISNEALSEERSIPPIPPIPKNVGSTDDSTTSLKTVVDSDDEPLPLVQSSSPVTFYPDKNLVGQEKERPSLQTSLTDEESVEEADRVSPISPVNTSQNKRSSVLPPPIPSGIKPSPIDSQDSNLPMSDKIGRSPTYDQQTALEENDDIIQHESHHDEDVALNSQYISIPNSSDKELKNDDESYHISPLKSPTSPHSTQSETSRSQPPKPLQLVSNKRLSIDMPRSAPPPPPSKMLSWEKTNDNFEPKKRAPSVPSINAITPEFEKIEDDLYSASPPRPSYNIPEHNPPPLPPRDSVAPSRDSIDIKRSTTVSRRSVDLSRISLDPGYVANDIDLAPLSYWWTQSNGVPPAFQGRQDLLLESVESSSSFGNKSIVLKELYVLFKDYSQTIVFAQYDPLNPADVKLEQKHEQPPRPHQDQLEQAHEEIGQCIIEKVIARKETTVGDGTPHDLVKELLSPFKKALPPVGNRVYGALVYCNIANACTQQNDEIRPGDIITLRNAKFQGKHGALGAKYTMEVGKPHHVGVVSEWDGTKKKIRAWEQGRESKKVKLESFKLDDLKSGEVKVWRIMPRSWVGWQAKNEKQN